MCALAADLLLADEGAAVGAVVLDVLGVVEAEWDEAAAEIATDEAQANAPHPRAETSLEGRVGVGRYAVGGAGDPGGVASVEDMRVMHWCHHRLHRRDLLHDDRRRLAHDRAHRRLSHRLNHRRGRCIRHHEGEHIAWLLVGRNLHHHGALRGHNLHLPARRDAGGDLYLHLGHASERRPGTSQAKLQVR